MSAEQSTEPDPRTEMEDLGYDIVYKPHEVMARYNAFYKVGYEGEVIAPPTGRDRPNQA